MTRASHTQMSSAMFDNRRSYGRHELTSEDRSSPPSEPAFREAEHFGVQAQRATCHGLRAAHASWNSVPHVLHTLVVSPHNETVDGPERLR